MIYVQQLYASVITEEQPGAMTVASLAFDTSDPYAVTLGIEGHGLQFGRDLLVKGGGEGDVEVYFNDDFYVIFVVKEVGIIFEKLMVEEFIEATQQLIPIGQESTMVDWDSEMKNILPVDNDPEGE